MSRHSPNLPMWEDLRFPAQGINPPGGVADPDVESTTGLLLFASNATETIAGVAQLPHGWKQGSTLKPHVHWTRTTSASGGVQWVLDYELVNNGATAAFTYGSRAETGTVVAGTPDNDTANECLISALGDITTTGIKISGLLLWKLYRDHDHANDTYGADARLIEFDIHYQIDAHGSEQEFIKQPS